MPTGPSSAETGRSTSRAGPATPHQVVALALDGVVLLDLAAPTHLFGHCGSPHYTFRLAGLAAGMGKDRQLSEMRSSWDGPT